MLQLGIIFTFTGNFIAGQQPFPVQFLQSAIGRNVTVCIDGRIKSTFAGKLAFRDSSGAGLSFCGDVRAPIRSGMTFAVKRHASNEFGGRVALGGNLVARHFRSAQTADQCAALQLAVWEAVEDGGPTASFGSGSFMAKVSPSVLAMAQQMYQAVNTPGRAIFLQAGNGNGQSQFTEAPV